jgi:hypothetical protein
MIAPSRRNEIKSQYRLHHERKLQFFKHGAVLVKLVACLRAVYVCELRSYVSAALLLNHQ